MTGFVKHPEVFLVPGLMLSDYLLTIWGAQLSERKYRTHFRFDDYELNPLWQKSVAQKKWFNPKHLLFVSAMAVFCVFWSNFWRGEDAISEGLFGYLTVLFASVIGTHIANILTFSYVARHPESVSGQIIMSHPLLLCISQFRALSLMFMLALVALFSPSPFVIGGLCSQIVLVVFKLKWLAKAKKTGQK